MSTAEILLLGAIAGGTIFLGLPIGRLQNLSVAARAGLSALATGILIFLLWDVLSGAVEPIESHLDDRAWGAFFGYAALGLAGFGVGYLSLVYYAEWMRRRSNRRASTLVGPGAAAIDEFTARGLSQAKLLALLIAVGIGVHNFGEGLAIGQAAANDLTGLAVTLVVGFALHNATEGFGICGPMAGERPTWGYLGLLGLIGGGPTFVGTLIGQAWTSAAVSVLFFAIAGGSILYVVQELFVVASSGL
jgi:ZIP family zinc transporter